MCGNQRLKVEYFNKDCFQYKDIKSIRINNNMLLGKTFGRQDNEIFQKVNIV